MFIKNLKVIIYAVILTACSGDMDFSSSTRAVKEGVNADRDKFSVDSDGNWTAGDTGPYNEADGLNENGEPNNGSSGDYDLDEGTSGSSSAISIDESSSSGSSSVTGGVDASFGVDLIEILPDPRLLRCDYKCAAPDVSMYRNLVGGYVTKRWRNIAPGKLVCLDHSTCRGDCKNGKLYSYDPNKNCERSAQEVGTRGADGCFHADTKILMGNGQSIAIKEIRKGDLVINPNTKSVMRVKSVITGPEKNPLYLVEHENGSTKVTSSHPFLLADGRIKLSKDLRVGDKVQNSKGQWKSLTKVQKLTAEEGQEVWNFTLDTESTNPSDHIVIADGIAAGDLWLQIDATRKSIAKN